MSASERTLLIESGPSPPGLSVAFAIVCIIDVFGVFPVVALPKAVIDCGYYGILIIITVCSVQTYTAILLGKCWLIAEKLDENINRKNRYPYSALTELTYGRTLSNFVTILLDITIFGGGIPNLIVASQNLQLLGLRLSNFNFDVPFCYWIIVLGTIICPVLWIGSPKDMKFLCTLSVSIVASVFLLITSCLILAPKFNIADTTNATPFWERLFLAYGIITFQFDIHPTILTIQVDMVHKSKLPLAVIGGFIATLGMFAVVSILAGLKFGGAPSLSILESLPTSVPLHLAALLVAIQLCLTSAVSNNALYQHMEDYLEISRDFNQKRCILRSILTILAVILAESVPRFDLVMSLIGGTLTGPLVFILPPLFYLRMLNLQLDYEKRFTIENSACNSGEASEEYKIVEQMFPSKLGLEIKSLFCQRWDYYICIVIVIVSTIFTAFTTYLNVVNAFGYTTFEKPCIFNISHALVDL